MKKHKLYVTLNGKKVPAVTITGLAKLCVRTSGTLRKWEIAGILPPANFRTPDVPLADGLSRVGYRVYSLDLALQVAAIVKTEMFRGIGISPDTIVKFKKLFEEERKQLE